MGLMGQQRASRVGSAFNRVLFIVVVQSDCRFPSNITVAAAVLAGRLPRSRSR
jgi:hypothetical protein